MCRRRAVSKTVRWGFLLLLTLGTLGTAASQAEAVRVAVASNFAPAMRPLVEVYEQDTGQQVVVSYGSTGKHYAQIRQGAPFEVFLAADEERPKRLERENLAIPGSRFTYAYGELVLWSPVGLSLEGPESDFAQGNFRRLALANPRLAPYGQAARETLQALGYWDRLSDRLVRGENIAQTYQFVFTGNAQLGFIARSQLPAEPEGRHWLVPAALYSPIRQQAVLVRDTAGGKAFLEFLRSDRARALIKAAGYRVD